MVRGANARPLLGAHVSAAGGLANAIGHAASLGAECIQIFGASPRQWDVMLPSCAEVQKFKKVRATSEVRAVYLHAPYLPNIATPDAAMLKKSIKSLIGHLMITDMLEADGLIFHIGSGKEMPRESALAQVVTSLGEILHAVPGHVRLVIENSAGGGQKVGATSDEIGAIMRQVGSSRLYVCVDTAHAFEAGMIERYTPAGIKKYFDDWDREAGLEKIVALHVNDSKTAFNSHHDRHENIGQGYIGLEGFRHLARETRLRHTSWILEVPGFDDKGPDKKNMDILRSCFT